MGLNGSSKLSELDLTGVDREDSDRYKKVGCVHLQVSTKENRDAMLYKSAAGIPYNKHQLGELEALLELKKTKAELQTVRNELQRMRKERDTWKSIGHTALSECYDSIKLNGLHSELSLKTLQYLDPDAAVKRLETHDRHIKSLFTKDRSDLAAIIQNVIVEIHYIKSSVNGDTLRWRLNSALNLMQHISKGLQKVTSSRQSPVDIEPFQSSTIKDECLQSTLKSADVQLLTILNEVREKGLNNYIQAFRETFAPEYDVVHHEFGINFYEKSKALMIQMYSQPTRLAARFEEGSWEWI